MEKAGLEPKMASLLPFVTTAFAHFTSRVIASSKGTHIPAG